MQLPAQPVVEGRLIRMVGLTLEAEGCKAPVGSRCLVISETAQGQTQIEAEVMGFAGHKVYLMPVDRLEGLQPGARVVSELVDLDKLALKPQAMAVERSVLSSSRRVRG